MSQDPWKHRSKGMVCGTCIWCAAKSPSDNEGGSVTVLGRCRRHAPTVNGYPVIYIDTDWCGDHKLDETKI